MVAVARMRGGESESIVQVECPLIEVDVGVVDVSVVVVFGAYGRGGFRLSRARMILRLRSLGSRSKSGHKIEPKNP